MVGRVTSGPVGEGGYEVERCLDEETIQRLLDGELPASAYYSAESHMKDCPSCLEAAREAEHEEAFISSFFAPQVLTAIPTARLWGRIHGALWGEGSAARRS